MITEEFDSPLGQPTNYDMYNATHRDQLLAVRHVNLRSFVQTNVTLQLDMQALDSYSITQMDAATMNDLIGDLTYFAGEGWTGGTCAPDAANHNVNALSIACTAAVEAAATSIVLDSQNSKLSSRSAEPNLKVLMDVDPTATLCLTLPGLSTTGITAASSHLELTSEPTGAFTDYTVSLLFSAGTVDTGSVSWPLTAVTATKVGTHFLDPSAITAVRVRLLSTANETVKIEGLRALGTNWQAAYTDDWDTRYQRFARTLTRNGVAVSASESVFRAANPPAFEDDPRPIDTKLMCAFNAGTVGAESCSMTFYFRERAEDYQTQLDLDVFTQGDLEGIRAQPDYGRSLFASRPQSELELLGQNELDTQDQGDLEREQDLLSAAWIEAGLIWSSGGTTLTIKDTTTPVGSEYILSLGSNLTAGQDYLLTLDLELNTLRTKLQKLDEHGTVTGIALWDESITDDGMFRRRKGRVGWNVNLLDGQAYVDSIRTAKTMFAEYQSLPFRSLTPADGIELFVSAIPDRELVTGIVPGPYGGTVVPDLTHSNSDDGAFKVTAAGSLSLQGIMTTPFLIEDFDETALEFDIFYPQASLLQGGSLECFLLGDRGRILELPLPQITGDHWQTIRFSALSTDKQQTGSYRAVIWQPAPLATTWWFDNLSVKARSMAWSGRVNADSDWLSFRDTYNADRNGLRLPEHGYDTQVRGRALRQDAYFSKVAFKPRYATLGRLVWPEDKPAATSPTAVATHSASGTTVTFHGGTSTTTADFIIDWTWYFGDGSFAKGPDVHHQYAASGTYAVVLTVIDNRGYRDSVTVSVTV